MGRRFKETGTAQPARQDEQDICEEVRPPREIAGQPERKTPAADAAVRVDASTTRTGVTMSPRHAWAVLISMVVGQMASALNQTTMVASLPVIMAEFGINPTTGQWLTTAYVLCIGIMMPLSAFLMARHHVRHLFALALGVFFAGAMIGVFQHNFAVLVLGRCVQACGAGLVVPIVQIVAFRIFPYNKRGEAMGVASMAVSVAPAVGPVLAGVLTDTLGWRSIFTITGAMALLSMAVSWFMTRDVPDERSDHHFDVPSFVLSSVMAVCIVLGCSNAGSFGILAAATLVPLAVGIAALVAFVRRELRIDDPLLDMRAFFCHPFALGCVTAMLLQGSVIAINNFVCIYVQDIQGYSATLSGFTMLPGAIVMMVLSPITGRLLDRHGPRPIAIAGFVLICLATYMLSTLTPTSPLWMPIVYQTLRFAATAFITQNILTWGINKLESGRITQGTATANSLRQMGAATVNALFFSMMDLMTPTIGQAAAITTTFSIMNGVQIALGVAVLGLMFTVMRKEAVR